MMLDYDVLVIGGGAAGFFAAVNTAKQNSGLRIGIFERGNSVLSKVKISGIKYCQFSRRKAY